MAKAKETKKTHKTEKDEAIKFGYIKQRPIVQEMQESYLDYAMSVIVSRALPDVRDGLKPVHRRILYAMWSVGLRASAKFRKSAMVVGEVLGKYHPHGDIAVYDSLSRMAQDFSMRYPLIKGQGNFGSIDGDRPAAMRYCVTGDTLILTDGGAIPIKKISNKIETKINLKILNYQGKKLKANRFFNSGKHKIIKLTTRQGYELKGSYNHPVLCWKINEFGFPVLQWEFLKELTTDKYVIINRNFSLFNTKIHNLEFLYPKNARRKNVGLPKTMNGDLAFLLGALVSEGSFHQKQILFNNQDLEFYNKVRLIIQAQFPGVQLYERQIKGNCWELSLYHQKAVEFLENIGLNNAKSDRKEIPFIVLSSDKKIMQEFLIALFEGDGSVVFHEDKRHGGKSLELTYNSKSYKLIQQLKIILLNFGIVTTLPYKDKRSNCYKLLITGKNNIQRFKEGIGFFSKRKNDILAKISGVSSQRMSKTDWIPFLNNYLKANYKSNFVRKHNFDRYNNLEKNLPSLKKILKPQDKRFIEWILKNRFFFDKIKTIEKQEKEENVYSIRVSGKCHSFIANGFINHNTEAKLSRISEEMLYDLEKETVKFIDNYDATQQEPSVLPAKFPNILLNGSMGIAVGMATNIPPHNLTEVADGTIHLIDNPDATVEDLLEFVKGPDFPTAGYIFNKKEIAEVYKQGKGAILMRGKAEIVEGKKDFYSIIISEIPYQVNKSEMIEHLANLVRDKKLEGIRDIRDESDKDGIRIVIELKREAFPKKVLNQLYANTRLQEKFHVNMLALVDGIQPRVLNLKNLLEYYIKHRKEVITKRAEYDLKKAKERAHILEGLKKAIDHISEIIRIIRQSKDKEAAAKNLIKRFKFSAPQTQAILEMKLSQLAALERLKIEEELKEKKKLIKELMELLGSPKKILGVVKKELIEVKEKYGDERRTKIVEGGAGEFTAEDLIPNEQIVVTITHGGYIKSLPDETYSAQKRGGKGVKGMEIREEDVIEHCFASNTHANVLFFTNSGKVFQLKAYEIPKSGRTSKGQSIVNFLQLNPEEHITAIVPIEKKTGAKFLAMVTKNAVIKKVELNAFDNVRHSGLIAIKIKNDDELKWVKSTSGEDDIILITSLGQSIRFKENNIRAMGRQAAGVRGMKLKGKDKIIGMDIIESVNKNQKVMILTENGYGKQSDLGFYKVQGRGGSGIKTVKVTSKNGQAVFGRIMNDNIEELIIISKKGQVIRIDVKAVSDQGRATQGVRVMRLDSADKIASVACI